MNFKTKEAQMRKQRKHNDYDYSALVNRIKSKYGTIAAFAKEMGCLESAMSMRLNNKTAWSQDDMFKAIGLLDIPEKQVMSFFYTLKVKN